MQTDIEKQTGNPGSACLVDVGSSRTTAESCGGATEFCCKRRPVGSAKMMPPWCLRILCSLVSSFPRLRIRVRHAEDASEPVPRSWPDLARLSSMHKPPSGCGSRAFSKISVILRMQGHARWDFRSPCPSVDNAVTSAREISKTSRSPSQHSRACPSSASGKAPGPMWSTSPPRSTRSDLLCWAAYCGTNRTGPTLTGPDPSSFSTQGRIQKFSRQFALDRSSIAAECRQAAPLTCGSKQSAARGATGIAAKIASRPLRMRSKGSPSSPVSLTQQTSRAPPNLTTKA